MVKKSASAVTYYAVDAGFDVAAILLILMMLNVQELH